MRSAVTAFPETGAVAGLGMSAQWHGLTPGRRRRRYLVAIFDMAISLYARSLLQLSSEGHSHSRSCTLSRRVETTVTVAVTRALHQRSAG
eukprot:426487-Pleurochrysis_carterae.AAC.1